MCEARGVTCEVGSGSYFSGLGHHYAQLAVVNFDVAALDISHTVVLLAFRVKHSTSSARSEGPPCRVSQVDLTCHPRRSEENVIAIWRYPCSSWMHLVAVHRCEKNGKSLAARGRR